LVVLKSRSQRSVHRSLDSSRDSVCWFLQS